MPTLESSSSTPTLLRLRNLSSPPSARTWEVSAAELGSSPELDATHTKDTDFPVQSCAHPKDPAHREDTVKGNDGGEVKDFLSGSHGVWDEGVVTRKQTLLACLWTYLGRIRSRRSIAPFSHPISQQEQKQPHSLSKSTEVAKES